MPNLTAIVGGSLGLVIVVLGIWLGILKIEVSDLKAAQETYKSQVKEAATEIVKATDDIKACKAVNDDNQVVLKNQQAADDDILKSVTADYERRLASAAAVRTQRGIIDADVEKCPAAGGVPASIRSSIDFLRRSAGSAAPAPAGGHNP